MTNGTTTNEMLYELIKDLKDDVISFKEDVKSFKEEFKSFKVEVREEFKDQRTKINDLWENRNKQSLNFSSVYFLVTFFSTILASLALSYLLVSLMT